MTRRKRILLVESDPEIRGMISVFLPPEPYDIVESDTVSAALQSLSPDGPFDIAILAFWLGQNHTVAVLDMLKSKGAVVFLQKPFHKAALLNAVTFALNL